MTILKINYRLVIIPALSIFMNFGCNKDQRYVNKISGEWEATEMTISDTSSSETYYKSDSFKLQFNFEDCKLKEDDWCSYSGNLILPDDTINSFGIYKSDINSDKVSISGKGTVLVLTDPDHIEEEGYTSWYAISLYEKNSVLLMSSVNNEEDIHIRLERDKN